MLLIYWFKKITLNSGFCFICLCLWATCCLFCSNLAFKWILDVEAERKFLNNTNIAISVYLKSKLDYSLRFFVLYDWVLSIAKMLKVKTEYKSLNGTNIAISIYSLIFVTCDCFLLIAKWSVSSVHSYKTRYQSD